MGGRERAPAALCRKAVEAKLSGDPRIEIWGGGSQTRSLLYVDDAIDATLRLGASDGTEPLELGGRERVSIDALVSVLEEVAGIALERRYLPDAPTGAADLGCDGADLLENLGWEPGVPLREGLEKTYKWVHDEYLRRWGGRLGPREAAPGRSGARAALARA
jgi:nucleoside-diphosphate-sugar epimerase